MYAIPGNFNDAGDLAELGGDQADGMFTDARDIDLHLKAPGRRDLGSDPARDDIEVLEALEDASERAGISFRRDAKTKDRRTLRGHAIDSLYALSDTAHTTAARPSAKAGSVMREMLRTWESMWRHYA